MEERFIKLHAKLFGKKRLWTTKEADEIFSLYIRIRDVTCYFGCGRPGSQNSHFWGRGNSGTRYDPLNCDGACGKCHLENEGSKQGLYRELKLEQLGKTEYDLLERRARGNTKRADAIRECMGLLSTTAHS